MKQNNRTGVAEQISLQSWLRPELTHVGANKDYHEFRSHIEKVGSMLVSGHLENMAVDFALEGFERATNRVRQSRSAFAIKALRIEVLRMLLGNPSYRAFSKSIASSDLLADFCGVRRIDGIDGISKSTLERATKFFTQEQVRWMSQVLLEMAGECDRSKELGLNCATQTDVCLVDTTCLDANIHFPVDWVLLRDVAGTLLKAIKLIRNSGLCERMPGEPEVFARQMSRLCIEMTHTRRKEDSRRARKRCLRKMKPLLKTIAEHARRHRDRLSSNYLTTKYSERQAKRIITRIDAMLGQVPVVIKQAHERIIGERQVHNQDKVISAYDADVHVIVRGKSGREVEFGNTLFLAESRQGLIMDFAFYQKRAPSEPKQLEESIERQDSYDLSSPIRAVSADRGFSSNAQAKFLKENGIYDAVCPKNTDLLKSRMQETDFVDLQRRRASTEARISIFKQRQARRLRCRGFGNRYRAVAWGVLGHNLWLLARILQKEEIERIAA